MKFLFLFLLALTGCSSMSSKPYVTEPAGSHKRAGILQNLFGVEGTTVEVPAPALKPEPKKRILENASEKENPLKVSKEKEQRKQMYEAQERAAVQPRATEDFSQALSAREKEEAMKKSNEASVKNASDGSKEGLLPPADNYKKHTVQVTVTTLQHPVRRDLATCKAEDLPCIQYYEKNGYLKIQDKPHFTGEKDMPQNEGYPPRKWREENIIPRF